MADKLETEKNLKSNQSCKSCQKNKTSPFKITQISILNLNYKFLIPAILSTLFIIYMSSRPDQRYLWVAPTTERAISNLAHIPAYALITYLWLRSFVGPHKYITYLIIIGVLLFSISDEIHQSFIPGRTASIADFGLDLIGIFSGILALNLSKIITSLEKR